jgi:hypothetical protein
VTAAAQRPNKEVKLDFFLMHGTNSSIFFPTFMKLPWLSDHNKARLLEWKVRIDLALYVSRGSPKLYIHEITSYPIKRDWNEVFNFGINNANDDGHVVKMMRAVALGERFCHQYENKGIEGGFPIHGDMWLRIGNMSEYSFSHCRRLPFIITRSFFRPVLDTVCMTCTDSRTAQLPIQPSVPPAGSGPLVSTRHGNNIKTAIICNE